MPTYLLLLLLALNCGTGLVVVQPSSLVGKQVDAVVYSRFFGPQSNYEQNGTALYYSHSVCHRVEGNFTGKIIVYPSSFGCSLKTMYLNLWRTGAVASVQISPFPVPGQTYEMHDGDWGKHTKHKSMVWLQAYNKDFDDITDALKSGEEQVILEITVDPNKWKDLYSSLEFIIPVRVILPCMFFMASFYGAYLLRQFANEETNAMWPTKIVVVGIETCCMMICGLFLAVEGLFADDNLPYQAIWFFGTSLFGWGMFTTILVSLFYYSLNNATKHLQHVKNSLERYKYFVAVSFVICVGMDLCIGSMFAAYQDATSTLAVGALMFSFGNFIVAVFFVREKMYFRSRVLSQNKKWGAQNSRADLTRVCEHLGRWLLISAIFMFMFSICTPLLAFPFAWTPAGVATLTPLLFFIRWGTAFTQMRGLSWKKGVSRVAPETRVLTASQNTTSASLVHVSSSA